MARPVHCRRIGWRPENRCFIPQGMPMCCRGEVVLGLDEVEAMRLSDVEGLYHSQAAEEMNVSRQTFGRIIESAHKKVAQALIEGMIIRIEGGNVEMSNTRQFECYTCRHVWEVPHGLPRPDECPECKSTNIHRASDQRGRPCGAGMGHGRCRRQRQMKCGTES